MEITLPQGKNQAYNAISLQAEDYADINFRILDGSEKSLVQASSIQGNETLYLADLPGGWYYVHVGFGRATYSLTLTTGDLYIGAITGQVTNSLASGVQNVLVFLQKVSPWNACGAVYSDAAGDFKFAYSPGTYKIEFYIESFTTPSDIYVLPGYYNGKSTWDDADVVTIQANQTTSLAVAQLADGAAVSGKITDSNGEPNYFASAGLYLGNGSPISGDAYWWGSVGWADGNGDYIATNIPIGDGTCRVQFRGWSPPSAVEWYNDKPSFSSADSVPLLPRQTTTGISAQLAPEGKITGRVSDGSDNGLEGVRVIAYDTIQTTLQLGTAYTYLTNSNGEYTLPGLPTANARVYFDPGNASQYQPEYYNDKPTFSSADSISVTSGQTTPNIDAQLGLRPIIVTSPNGGESWIAGSLHKITWTSTNPSVNGVYVNYSTDNGANWKTISLTADDGSMPWVVPQTLSDTCLVQVTDGLQTYLGDISNATFAITAPPKDDFLGTWDGQGVYFRNSETGKYVKLASPATLITAGDLDNESKDDLIGIWPGQGGVWARYSSSGAWAKLSSTARHIAAGDMNGDARIDLLGTWDGQGVYFRNSVSGAWTKLASPATLITAGDLDGDVQDDLIGIWPVLGGVWVKYSKTGTWSKLSSTAKDISSGVLRGAAWGSSRSGFMELKEPMGGYAEGPGSLGHFKDMSDNGPGGAKFVAREEINLSPQPQESGMTQSPPGPGDPGFVWVEQDNLVPQEQGRSAREKRGGARENEAKKKRT